MIKLAVDLDGVCANFLEIAINILDNQGKLDKQESLRILSLGEESTEYEMKLNKLLSEVASENIYSNLPIIENSSYYLNLLSKFKGININYISSRPSFSYGDTVDWLYENNFPKIENLHLVHNKSSRINSIAIDIMIEDRLLEVRRLLENTDCNIILLNTVYNQFEFKTKRVKRVNNWKEIYNYLIGVR